MPGQHLGIGLNRVLGGGMSNQMASGGGAKLTTERRIGSQLPDPLGQSRMFAAGEAAPALGSVDLSA
jgi:hypothetical protein